MGRCLQYKFPCGCEVWKGLDCNSKSYIEYIEDNCKIKDLEKQLTEMDRFRNFWFDAERRKLADWNMLNDVNHDLRKQLAELEAKTSMLETMMDADKIDMKNAHISQGKDLAEAQIEVVRLEDQLANCYDEHPYIVGG